MNGDEVVRKFDGVDRYFERLFNQGRWPEKGDYEVTEERLQGQVDRLRGRGFAPLVAQRKCVQVTEILADWQ